MSLHIEKDAPPGSLSEKADQTSIVCLWYRARQLAEPEIERMTTNALLAHERELKRLRADTAAGHTRTQAAHPEDKAGRPSTHLGELTDSGAVRMEVRSVEQLEQQAEAQDFRRGRHLVRIFDIYMSLGAEGSNWDSADVPQAERKSAFVRSLQHQTTEKLGAMLRAGIRLEIFLGSRAAENDRAIQWWRLKSPSVLSSYLEARACGGPTAAGQVLNCLRWWNKFAGTTFPTEHRFIGRFDGSASGHITTPAQVLFPCDVLNLLTLARQRTGTQGLIARQICMAVVDVVRFAHRSRICPIAWDARLITLECSAGKRYKRKSGARVGYQYSIPRVWSEFSDIASSLLEFWESHGTDGGLCPGLRLGKSRVVDADAVWLQKPMSYRQFSAILQGMLVATGHSALSASGFTYNSLRRTLPTMADICRVDDADAQAVGNWQEVVATGAKRQQACEPMCRRYSGGKIAFSGTIKGRLLSACVEYTRRLLKRRNIAPNSQGFFPHNCVSWEDLRGMHIPTADVEGLWDRPGWAAGTGGGGLQSVSVAQGETTSPPRERSVSPPADPATPSRARSGSSDSSDSSGSSSSGSGNSRSSAPSVPGAPEPTATLWFMQGWKVHIMCMRAPNGYPVPKCREESEKPFKLEATTEGTGDFPQGAQVCRSCTRRLPVGSISTGAAA